MAELILHDYWRSGAAWRVRMALSLKNVPARSIPVDLSAGAQAHPAYRAVNPQALVPALEAEGTIITQSLAILEWLEETHPTPPLLPKTPLARAQVRAMCALIACDIHPLQNLRVQNYLKAHNLNPGDWTRHWLSEGLAALETLVSAQGQGFCHGDSPTMADCFLIPQLYAARRFKVDMAPYPALLAVEAKAMARPEIARAHPDAHPDKPD